MRVCKMLRAGWGGGSLEGRGGTAREVGDLATSCTKGPCIALASSVCSRGQTGVPSDLPRHAQGGGYRFCVPGWRGPRCVRLLPVPSEGVPRGLGLHTHLLKSKGIVPPPPGVGPLQARWAAAPRGSQPAANASTTPAGRPQTPAASLPPPGSDAPRSPLGAGRRPRPPLPPPG